MESLPQRIGDLFPRTNRHRLTMTNATHLHKRADTPEAATKAAKAAAGKAKNNGADEAVVAQAAATAAAKATPRKQAQRSFTDPEARMMKTTDGFQGQSHRGRDRRRP